MRQRLARRNLSTLVGKVLVEERVKITAICDIDPQARDRALIKASRDNPI
jgi:hypothetical protein